MFEINDCKNDMQETVSAHELELKNIRTGRVSPDILKTIIVDSYGSKMPLTQLANINNLDNMTLNVAIWDSGIVKSAEKSILESNLGVTPQTDGNNLLLKFPELTAERRKDLAKFIHEISEKYKISLEGFPAGPVEISFDDGLLPKMMIKKYDVKSISDVINDFEISNIEGKYAIFEVSYLKGSENKYRLFIFGIN